MTPPMNLNEYAAKLEEALVLLIQLDSTEPKNELGGYTQEFADTREKCIRLLWACYGDAEGLPSLLQSVWRDEVPKEIADLRTSLDVMVRRLRASWANGWSHPISNRGGAPVELVQEFEEHQTFVWRMVNRIKALAGVADLGARLKSSVAGESQSRVFRLVGQFWQVVYENERGFLKDSIGIQRIAALLQKPNPTAPIESLELVLSVDHGKKSNSAPSANLGRDVVLDKAARKDIADEITELKQQIQEESGMGERALVEQLEQKLEALMQQLRQATGIGNRDRMLGADSPAIAAARTVGKSNERAIDQIRESMPMLAEHLTTCITKVGSAFAYRPDPGAPTWDL